MTTSDKFIYPIGTPGQPWQAAEKQAWLAQQTIKRSYRERVVSEVKALSKAFVCQQYGELVYRDLDRDRGDAAGDYPLYALTSRSPVAELPWVLVTGGVHGYETSGVHGVLQFAQQASDYANAFNFVLVPCVSPWGYETINRWNPDAIDPNRSFREDSPAQESALLWQWIRQLTKQSGQAFLAHFDLHETTDTDNSEFRPALAARDAIEQKSWMIPDGFYGVADTGRPQVAFQKAIIESVEKVTHIAPDDGDGKIIGAPLQQKGVIEYDKKALFLCGGMTDAPYVTTTEVYPDSAKTTPENCIQAQVAAVRGGLDYLMSVN